MFCVFIIYKYTQHTKIGNYIVIVNKPHPLLQGCIFLISRDRILRANFAFVWNYRFWSFCEMRRRCYTLYILCIAVMVVLCFSNSLVFEVRGSYLCVIDNFHIFIET